MFHFCKNCERESHLKTETNDRVFHGNSRLHITLLDAGQELIVPDDSEPSFVDFEEG
jgi:hypothetical protein